MANEGYTDIAATTQDTLRFSWRVVSQSTENNTTTLAWEMLLIAAAQGYIQSSYSKDWSVTVAGKTYSGTNKVSIGNNSQKVLASGTTEISHNADGTKSFSYYFSQQFNIYWTGKLVRTVDGSGSGTLPNIARATAPVLSPASQVMGSAISISLPRASEAFTHTLQYFFGSASGTIASGAAASASWTVPASLAAQLPGAASGTGTIRCITYNGASQVGTRDVSFTASVPSSLVPSISSVAVTDTQSAVASAFGAFVQGKSTLKVVTQQYHQQLQGVLSGENLFRHLCIQHPSHRLRHPDRVRHRHRFPGPYRLRFQDGDCAGLLLAHHSRLLGGPLQFLRKPR